MEESEMNNSVIALDMAKHIFRMPGFGERCSVFSDLTQPQFTDTLGKTVSIVSEKPFKLSAQAMKMSSTVPSLFREDYYP